MDSKVFLDGITAAVDSFVDRSSQNGEAIKSQFRQYLDVIQPDVDSILNGESTDPNALSFIRDRSAAALGRIVLSANDTQRVIINETIIGILHAAIVWAPLLL
jgi:uncharacterized protein YicC (UPF0701 family)